MQPITAVLFDFAGTLVVPCPPATWVRTAAGALGLTLDEAETERLATAYAKAGIPGGPYPAEVPRQLSEVYAARDVSPEQHRAAYVGLLDRVEGPPGLAAAVYEQVGEPNAWTAYTDAAPTLDRLHERGIAIGVLSNAGFDIRPILRGNGLAHAAERCTISFEHGLMKPDPRLFEIALEALGADATSTLMVGDSPAADGAAADLGLRTLLLPMTPPGSEHGLAHVLGLLG